MRTDDVDTRQQMALPPSLPANHDRAASAEENSGSVFFQSAIDNRGVNSSYDGGFVNSAFVHDVVVDIAQDRIGAVPADIPSADLCFSRRYLGPRVPLLREGITRVFHHRPRRLWFERRHWGSDAPDFPVQFPRSRGAELGQGIAGASSPVGSAEDSSPKVVYNIGVFYSDTDLCGSGSSASEDEKSSERVVEGDELSSASEKEIGISSVSEKGDELSSVSEKTGKISSVSEKEDGLSSASKIIKLSAIRESSARTDDVGDKSFTDPTGPRTPDDLLREGSSAPPAIKTYENVRGGGGPRLLPAHNNNDKRIVVVRPPNTMTGPSGGTTDHPPATRRSSNNRSASRRQPATTHTQLTPDTYTTPTLEEITTPQQQLPDILNSHLPPPYSTLPPPVTTPTNSSSNRRLPPPSHPPPPPPPPLNQQQTSSGCPRAGAFRNQRPHARRAGRRSAAPSSFVPAATAAASESDEPKHCCGVRVTQTVSIRWFIVMIAFVGLCCAVVGTVLGALKATGREHLTVSLLMIGEYSFISFINLYHFYSHNAKQTANRHPIM